MCWDTLLLVVILSFLVFFSNLIQQCNLQLISL